MSVPVNVPKTIDDLRAKINTQNAALTQADRWLETPGPATYNPMPCPWPENVREAYASYKEEDGLVENTESAFNEYSCLEGLDYHHLAVLALRWARKKIAYVIIIHDTKVLSSPITGIANELTDLITFSASKKRLRFITDFNNAFPSVPEVESHIRASRTRLEEAEDALGETEKKFQRCGHYIMIRYPRLCADHNSVLEFMTD